MTERPVVVATPARGSVSLDEGRTRHETPVLVARTDLGRGRDSLGDRGRTGVGSESYRPTRSRPWLRVDPDGGAGPDVRLTDGAPADRQQRREPADLCLPDGQPEGGR